MRVYVCVFVSVCATNLATVSAALNSPDPATPSDSSRLKYLASQQPGPAPSGLSAIWQVPVFLFLASRPCPGASLPRRVQFDLAVFSRYGSEPASSTRTRVCPLYDVLCVGAKALPRCLRGRCRATP
jgi:hypothetical protein